MTLATWPGRPGVSSEQAGVGVAAIVQPDDRQLVLAQRLEGLEDPAEAPGDPSASTDVAAMQGARGDVMVCAPDPANTCSLPED